ncbi:MAG: GAF domain-containing protein [Candidatus Krumholzibacteria bacterium]|nr:GAF domain-containing protein [Candidatus Krumholzibacteria bacterium]
MPPSDAKSRIESIEANNLVTPADRDTLYRHTWRNWFLLAGVLVLTSIGLASAIPPLLSERHFNPWPWMKTDLVLLVGLSLTVLVFVAYLTQQQRIVMRMHKRFLALQEGYERRLVRHTARMYALASVSNIMSVETDLRSILQSITNVCAETFNCHRSSLMLLDAQKNELVVRSVSGHSDLNMLDMRQKVGEGIAGWSAAHREPILLRDAGDCARYPDLKFNYPSLTSTMVVPILLRDEIVGVINATSNSPDITYDDDDLRAFQVFAGNAGACIRHAEHVNWLKQMIPHLKKPLQEARRGRPAAGK